MFTKLRPHLGTPRSPSCFFLLPWFCTGGRGDLGSAFFMLGIMGWPVRRRRASGHLGSTEEGCPDRPLADWEQLPCGGKREPALQAEEGVGEGWGGILEAVACALVQRIDQVLYDHGI